MVSRVDTPHTDPATVAQARGFIARHRDSRWAGEALRIVAMAEWDAGHFEASSDLWRRFAAAVSRPDRSRGWRTPSTASRCVTSVSAGLPRPKDTCGPPSRPSARVAMASKAWIAADAAERLSSLERSAGRYALAGYWKTKSATFANVYSTE